MILNNLGLVVTTDLNGIISINTPSFHLFRKADFKRFRKTMRHTLIMGRRTWDLALNLREQNPFSGHTTCVVTRRPLAENNPARSNQLMRFTSVDAVLTYVKSHPRECFWCAGGASIYQQMLPYCTLIDTTIVPIDCSKLPGRKLYFHPTTVKP